MQHYGGLPQPITSFQYKPEEVFYFLYLPISLPGQMGFTLPKQLHPFIPLIEAVRRDEPDRFESDHVYITGKHMIVGPGISANRPGWHSDGFGTDDLNYIWCDSLPTVFNPGPFHDIPKDDHLALQELSKQAFLNGAPNWYSDVNKLYKLTPAHIHRVADNPPATFMRTFIKVSVSRHQYNLDGNSINHDLDYSWKRFKREDARNSPHHAGKDFYNPPKG